MIPVWRWIREPIQLKQSISSQERGPLPLDRNSRNQKVETMPGVEKMVTTLPSIAMSLLFAE